MVTKTLRPDSYTDENGLVHPEKGVYSENGSLFSAHVDMLDYLLGNPVNGLEASINITKEGWFDPNPADENTPDAHFSHDNMTGLYVLYFLNGRDVRNLPSIKWNGRYWLHPRDIIFYSIMKNNKLANLLLPLLFIMAYVSCRAKRQHTSGKCLWWLRMQALMLRSGNVSIKSKKFMTKLEKLLVKEHFTIPSSGFVWVDIFSIYFTDYKHIINEKIRTSYV